MMKQILTEVRDFSMRLAEAVEGLQELRPMLDILL